MTAERDRLLAEIDAFLAETKTLHGDLPQWGPSSRPRDLQAAWPLADSAGVIRAEIRCRCERNDRTAISLSVIYRGQPIWRVDLEAPSVRHTNPPWAALVGRPPVIYGSHSHAWPDNVEHLRGMPPEWDLPCRRSLPVAIRRLPQLLPWFADAVHINLAPQHRAFDVPPQADLFEQR